MDELVIREEITMRLGSIVHEANCIYGLLDSIVHEANCIYGLLDDLAIYLPDAEQGS